MTATGEASVRAAHVHLPGGATTGPRSAAADEDTFTLAVEAGRHLLARTEGAPAPRVTRIDLVGSFDPDAQWALREALGLHAASLHPHPPGAAGAFGALSAAARASVGESASLLLAADLDERRASRGASSRWGAAGLAMLLVEGAGLSVLGHSERGHPSWKSPVAREWVAAARRAAGSVEGPLDLFLVAERAPPVLLMAWEKAVPGTLTRTISSELAGLGASPTVAPLLSLRAMSGEALGRPTVVAVIEDGRTAFLGTSGSPSISWSESSGGGSVVPSAGATDPPEAVSQGAYVPQATYLENLPSRWRLVAERCPQCGRTSFPARGACRHCGTAEGLESRSLPDRGLEVEAVTTISPGAQPAEFDPWVEAVGSYDVVVVRADPEVRLTAQMADTEPGSTHIGDRVRLSLRRLYRTEGAWRYGLKAVREVR